MLPDIYSYTREEDEGVHYTFATLSNIAFAVSFTPDGYEEYLENFPALLEKGYCFSFFSKQWNQDCDKNDERVFSTLYSIIKDFMSDDIEKTSVLLYHCDGSDGKEEIRNRLFDRWERKVSETDLFRHTTSVEIRKDDKEVRTYYMGFITFCDNPHIDALKREFEEFCYYLVLPKPGDFDEHIQT